ncbi:hypothetical protein MMC14_008942 [Varicellaria rhodocarpa]|nr:hypothetical protein [Varicellaria rhodocarpa]
MNFTDFNEPQPSMLKTLKNASLISSTSWAYTAGAFYQEPKVFGSLTLGGYDTNRFTPNNMTIPFGADESRDLLVGIQAITSDTTDIPLLSTGVYAFIDSLVPQIWLPLNACTAFEQAFNLTWDNSSQLYLLTNDQHESLLGLNANLTFKIGLSATEGPSVDIVLPYGAFDLTVSPPLVENTTRCLPLSLIMSPLNTDDSPRYFPIRRSQNDTQYTLGRTFLQQAYVIADYDRSSFSVSQALFPSTSVSQNLRAILSPSISASQEHHVSTKTIIASVTSGSAIFFAIVIFVLLFLRRRRHRRSTREQGQRKSSTEKDRDQYYQKPELDAIGPTRVELDATGTLNELDALSLSNNHIDPPLRVDAFRAEAVPTSYELAAEDVPRPELESPHIPGKQQAGT